MPSLMRMEPRPAVRRCLQRPVLRAKILISVIDDDEDSRASITSLIESPGFATMGCPN